MIIKHKIIALLFPTILSIALNAQPTSTITDIEKKYKDAKALFSDQRYSLAYPLFKELKEQYNDNTISNHTYINDDIFYYYTACQLKLMQPVAEDDAKHYIEVVNNEPRRQLMSYYLAKYYFAKNQFSNTIHYFERAGTDNLNTEELANTKFEKAYALFNLKQFDQAKALFNEIHLLPENKYYYDANYYYGFICYRDAQYDEALKSFQLVENISNYKLVVPYYIAEIYYFTGKKDEALNYAKAALAKGGGLVYEKEMKLLVGQLHFEKKEFDIALPLLEYYVRNTDKIDKEILYELSYCYYNNNQLTKAIDGFKQLSNQKDSMGQNSMYLLGDCYLKTNQQNNARTAFQYCAYNNSNTEQQEASRFIYAKLSYQLGYQDIALNELKKFIADYPNSTFNPEAKELMVNLMANTNNFTDALTLYQSMGKPTALMQKLYPKILFGKAIEDINDQKIDEADDLLNKVLADKNANQLTPYVNFWKGEIALRNQKYDDAIKYNTAFLQNNVQAQGEATPQAAKYNLGYSWMHKENYKQALNYFEQVAKNVTVVSPAIEQDAYVRSADCYFMNKDYAKASSMYDYVINNALPQSDYAFFQKSMIAGVKSPAEKIKTLNTLVRQYPKSNLIPDVNMEVANTFMAQEKFTDAIPYLKNIIEMPEASGLKPTALSKLGLSYYNINDNKNALQNYQTLIEKYPQSIELDAALDNIKNIYVEEGRPNAYIDLMRKNGKNISISEADSLTYTSAQIKYDANDCNAAIAEFNNYLLQYTNGAYALEANYYRSECYNKNKDFKNALVGYEYVNAKGQNRFFENATLQAARINYFELKDYATAQKQFESLLTGSINQDNKLEALRGLVRCYHLRKDFDKANETAKNLLSQKNISTDDKAIAFLVLGKSQQQNNNCVEAINNFKSCAALNKSAWGAEARYEIANCQFTLNNLGAAEKSALAVIKETSSYDNWVTKSYILLGDIFMQQKDYFNAKATYESVAKNSVITELKTEAQQKLDKAIEAEKATSKIISN